MYLGYIAVFAANTYLRIRSYGAYERTFENQNGLSCFNATGALSPVSKLTESYDLMSRIFQRPRGRERSLSVMSKT